MKLRLPHKLQAALVAALASVSFTTLSSGTLSAAFFFGSQAFAEEAADNTGATIDIGDTNLDPQAAIDEEEGKGEAKEPGSAPINQAGFNGIRGSSDDFDRQSTAESSIDTENVGTSGQANYGSTSADLPSNDLGFTSNSYASGSSNGSVVDSPVTSFTQATAVPAVQQVQYVESTTPTTSSGTATTGAATDGYSATPVSGATGGGSGYSLSALAMPRAAVVTVPATTDATDPAAEAAKTDSGSADSTPADELGSTTPSISVGGASLVRASYSTPAPAMLGAADEELTSFTTTNLSTASTTNNYNAKGFAVVLNGPRLATTSTDVPITTCDPVYLNSITLGSLRAVPAAGVTLALADATGKVLSVSKDIVSSVNQSVTWTFTNTTVATDSTLYFYWLDSSKGIAVGNTLSDSDLASWNNAGNGNSGVSDYNGISGVATDNSSCGYLDSLSHIQTANSRFAPKLTIVTSGPVPQDEYTWKASGSTGVWDEETFNWTLNGEDSKYVSDPKNIVNFNEGEFAKEVTVDGEIAAYVVNVGANYKFTVGSGDSLSISKLSVASGATATVENAGELYLAKVTGAGALEVGAGTVNLFGGNDFSGGLTVSGGVVHTTQVSALGSGTLTATGTGKIEIENTAPGNLTVLGDGTLRLMTTYAASSQQSNVELANIQAANLELGADEHHSSRFRNQNNPNLSGVGHLYFDGGQFWVSNAFTYAGAVTFNETVYKEVRTQSDNKLNDAALRVNANVTLTGKVDVAHNTRFTWQASNLAVEFGGEVVGSGNLELAIYSGSNNTFRISGDASAYGGSITSASGVALDITSGGKLSIGSGSNLQGAVNVSGGTLDLTSSVNTGAFSMSGGSLKLADGVTFTSSGAISLTGGMLDLSSVALSQGTYTLATSSTGSITYSGVDFTLNPSYVKSDYSLGVSGNSLVLTYNTPPTPKEGTFHVYILTGQSNSLGSVKDMPATDAIFGHYASEGLLFNGNMHKGGNRYVANPTWNIVDKQPVGEGDGTYAVTGPEYVFSYILEQKGWLYNQAAGDGLGIIKGSLDGGGNGYWVKGSGYNYGVLLDSIKKGILAANAMNYEAISLDGLMYLQGESNSGDEANAAATRFSDLLTNLTSDLTAWMQDEGISVALKFKDNAIAGEPATWSMDGTEAPTAAGTVTANQFINAATSNGQINADRNGMGFVYTRDLDKTNVDGYKVHYDGNSQIVIGARYAYAFAVQSGIDVGTVRGQDDSATLDTAAAWWMEKLPTANDVAVWDISSVSQSVPVQECNKIADGQSITVGGIRIEEVYSTSATALGQGSVAITGGSINLGNASLESGSGITLVGGDLSISSTINAVANQTWSTGDHQLTTSGTVNIQNGATLTIAGDSEWQFNVVQGTGNLVVTNGATLSMTQGDLNNHATGGSGYSDGNNGFLNGGYDLITLTGDNSSITINPAQITWDGALAGKDITLSADNKKLQILNGESGVYHVRDGVVVYNTATGITDATSIDINDMGSTGATLELATGLANNVTVTSSGNGGAIKIDNGVSLAATSVNAASGPVSITGSGTFVGKTSGTVASLAPADVFGTGVTLSPDWRGTVKIADTTIPGGSIGIKLNDLGNASSVVEFEGVKAFLNADSYTYAPNIKLTGTGLDIDAGTTNATYTFNGDVSGDGTLKLSLSRGSSGEVYVFAGDVENWNGEILAPTGGKTITLKFTGDADTVNAKITKTGGTLHLQVANNATFGANVKGINNLTTLAGTRVAFNGETTSINGTSSIGGTITNGGAMTLAGTVVVTGSLQEDYEVYQEATEEHYSGTGTYTGNGYLTTDAKFYLVKNATGGTLDSTATAEDANITLSRTDNNSLVFQNKAEGNVYYVNGELNWGDTMGNDRTTEVEVASNASLKLTELVSKEIVGNGTVKIDAGDGVSYEYHNKTFLENFTGTVDVVSGNLQVGSNATKLANATLRVSGGEVRAHTNAFVHDIILAGGGIAGAGANETYSGKITLEADSYIGRTGGGETVTLTGGLSGEYTLSTRGTSGATFNLNSATDIAGLALGAGTVNINNTAQIGAISGTGNVNVNANGSLSLEKTSSFTGNMTVVTGATLALAGEEMLTLSGTLTLQAGSTLDLARIFETQEAPVQANLFQVAPKASSLLSVGGNSGDSGLLSGGLLGAATPAPGDYILATANSIGSLDGVELANIAQGYTGTLSTKDANGDKQLILTLAAASNDLIWDNHAGTGNWNTADANWHTEAAPTTSVPFTANQNVRFDSNADGKTVTLTENITAGTVEIQKGVAVKIVDGNNKTLSGTLIGAGTYVLNDGDKTLPGSLNVSATDWSGVVRLSGTHNGLSLGTDLQGLNSTVELKGVTGYFSEVSAGNTDTFRNDLVLTNDNTTDAVTITAGYTRDRNYYKFAGKVSGDGTFEVNADATNRFIFSGDVSDWKGQFHVTKAGAKNPGAYGANGSEIVFADDAHVVNATLTRDGGTMNLVADTNTTFNKAVSGFSKLTVTEGNTATFKDVLTQPGNVALAGTLVVDSDSTTASSISGAISGGGAIVKNGTGTLELGGNNTSYTGNITVSSGTLKLNSAHALGADNVSDQSTRSITIDKGGTIDLNSKDDGQYAYILHGGSLVNNGNDDTSSDHAQTTKLTLTDDSSIGGTHKFYLLASNWGNTSVDMGGKVLEKTGSNEIVMWSTNVTNGGTILISDGSLNIDRRSNQKTLSSLDTNINIAKNGSDALKGNFSLAAEHTISSSVAGATMSANVGLKGVTTLSADADDSLTLTGVLSNAADSTGSITKSGAGTVTLSGSNSYTGGTTVNAGTLVVGANGALGSGTTTVNSGGTLELTSTVSTLSNTINIASGGTLALGNYKDNAATISNLRLASGSILDLSALSFTGTETEPITLVNGGNIDSSYLSSVKLTFASGFTPEDAHLEVQGSSLVLTFAQPTDALIWDNHSGDGYWNVESSKNWHTAGGTEGDSQFTQNANVTFQGTSDSVELQEAITAGTMTLASGSNLAVNTAGKSLTVQKLVSAGGSNLTKSGDGIATFGGESGSSVTLGNVEVSGGTANFEGGPVTASSLAVTGDGTKVNFDALMTVNGNNRINIGYENALNNNEQVTFANGLEYTGTDSYAMVVGAGNTVSLGGTTDLSDKNVGVEAGGKLVVLEGATATIQRLFNNSDVAQNGALKVENGATVNLVGSDGGNKTKDLSSTISDLELEGSGKLNLNMSHRQSVTATIGSITGTGDIDISSTYGSRTYNITGDISGWNGAITQASTAGSMTLNISGTDTVNADIVNSAKTNPASILTLNLKKDMTVNGKVEYTAVAPIDMNVGDSGTAAKVSFTDEVKVRNLNVANAGSSATFRGPTQINGTISGNGKMTVNSGSNTVTVEGANNLKGDTTVTAGTLQLNGGGTMGKVIVNGGEFNTTGAQAITLNSLSVTDGIAHVGNSGNVNLGTVSLTGGDLVLNTTVSAGSLTTTSGATLTFAGENMLTTTGDIDLSGGLQLDLSNITYRTDTSDVQTITLATTSGAITLGGTYTFLNAKTAEGTASFTLKDDGNKHLVLEVEYLDVTDWPTDTSVSYTYTVGTGEEAHKETHYDIATDEGRRTAHGYNFSQTDDGVVEFNPNLFNNATHTYTDSHDIVMHSNTTIVVEEGNTVKLTGELSSENYSGGGISGTLIKDGAGTLEMAINDKSTGPGDYQRNTFEGSVEVSEGTLHVLKGKNGSELAAGDGAHVRVSKGATLDLEAGVSIGIPMGHRTKPEEGDSRAVVISAAGTPAIVQNAYISQDGVRPDDAQDGGRARVENAYELRIGNLQDMTQAVTIELSDIIASSVFLEGNVTIDNSHIQSSGDMRIYNDVNAPNTIRNNSIVELTGFWGLINNTDVDKTSKINFLPETEEYYGATLVGQNKVEVGSTENGGVATRTVSDTEITYLSDQYKGLVLGSDDYKSDLSLGITLSDVDLPDDLSGYKFTLTFEDFNTSYLFEEASSEFIPLEELDLNVSLFIPAYAGGQWEELVASVQVKYDTATGNTVFMFEHIMTPEPTTGTLSLLALAALAARRRRK